MNGLATEHFSDALTQLDHLAILTLTFRPEALPSGRMDKPGAMTMNALQKKRIHFSKAVKMQEASSRRR